MHAELLTGALGAAGFAAGYAIEKLGRTLARRTTTEVDDALFMALGWPLRLTGFVLGIHAALHFGHVRHRAWEHPLFVTLCAIGVFAAVRLAGRLVPVWASQHEATRPTAKLLAAIARVFVLVVGGIILLDTLGIRVSALVATLGVGSLAVALALQDTLANFFSGLYILADRPVRPGDYVRIDGGEEGFVDAITWRSTRIRTFFNNVVVVPNSKLAQSVVTNFSLPNSSMLIKIQVDVDYRSDPDQVERLLVEEASSAAGSLPELLTDPAPEARLAPGFGEYALQFTLYVHVRDVSAQLAVQHALRKRILARLRLEGIAPPLPQRVVQLRPT